MLKLLLIFLPIWWEGQQLSSCCMSETENTAVRCAWHYDKLCVCVCVCVSHKCRQTWRTKWKGMEDNVKEERWKRRVRDRDVASPLSWSSHINMHSVLRCMMEQFVTHCLLKPGSHYTTFGLIFYSSRTFYNVTTVAGDQNQTGVQSELNHQPRSWLANMHLPIRFLAG